MRWYSYHEHSEIRKPGYSALYTDISNCDATELGVGKPLQQLSSTLLQVLLPLLDAHMDLDIGSRRLA